MQKRLLAAALAMLLALGAFPALGEDEDEISLDDSWFVFVEIEDDEPETVPAQPDPNAAWTFPVALEDMDPMFIVLANKHWLLEKNMVPVPLVTMKARKTDKQGVNINNGVRKASGSEMKLQGDCAAALVTMFEAAEQDGIKLYLKSAYRSWQTQNTMYYNRLKKNNGRDDGWVSKPGASDHQTGLGCDIVSYSWRDKSMNGKFGATAEAKWMAAHCAEYGFILRYPEDKEDLTEINYEPWHLRYVGIPAATYIMENGLCLEEFHDQLTEAIQAFLDAGGDPAIVKPYIQVSAEY